MKRKLWNFLLVSVFGLTLLAACGDDGGGEPSTLDLLQGTWTLVSVTPNDFTSATATFNGSSVNVTFNGTATTPAQGTVTVNGNNVATNVSFNGVSNITFSGLTFSNNNTRITFTMSLAKASGKPATTYTFVMEKQ
ncbi:MAG: hypothetical protein HC913_11185 [Microscillaceae bacterium]|nr:hypothetical protein [Microscillaceae bacterium]